MKKFGIAILVIIIIAGMVYLNLDKTSDASVTSGHSARNAKPVKTTTIETGNVSSYVTAPGITEEVNKAQVFFDTPLRVVEVLVKKNEFVQKGDKLIVLDTSSLVEEMDRLKIQKEVQSITLEKMESGQSLLSLESSVISAKHNLDQTQDKYQTALDDYNEQLKLYETGLIPKTQLDQYEKAVKDMESAISTAMVNLESAQKAYDSSVDGLDLDIRMQIKNVELLSAQILSIEKQISKIENLQKAPIEGFVTQVNVIEGGYTISGQPAFTIIDAGDLQITATVREYNSKQLAVGQPVEITGEALGDGTVISGVITAVAPVATQVQSANGYETVIEVTIAPEDENHLLKPGLNVDCEIITEEKKDVVVADFSIFMDENRTQYVMVVDKEKMTVRKQYVTLGTYSDMFVEVVDGLNAGDVVVIDPQASLEDGDKIRITE